MASSLDSECLRVCVPVAATASARELLAPYLIHDGVHGRVESPDAHTRALTLHPRVRDRAQLPRELDAPLEALGARWDTRELDALDEAAHAQLFTVVFFSKSKPGPALAPALPDTWRRVLSNFHRAELELEGLRYASVEHYFQGQKALCSTRPGMAPWFAMGCEAPEAVDEDPAAAKRAGGRKAYARAGASLDAEAWLRARLPAMARALEARWRQQPLFRAVLESTAGMQLLHFERSGARSFWGGSLARDSGLPQGSNALGRMLMQLRERQKVDPSKI